MGYRLHYLKTFKVEYGGGLFSYKTDQLAKMISEQFDDAYSPFDDGEQDSYELQPEAVKTYVEKLRKLAPNGVNQYFKGLPKDDRYTNKEVADYWQEVLDNYDKDNDYIRLEWF